MPIGSILCENGKIYNVNDNLFVGLVDKNEKLEIRSCTIQQFAGGRAEIKIDGVEDKVWVEPRILGYKKRHISKAISFDFETNSIQ